jgi:hypothetical protein
LDSHTYPDAAVAAYITQYFLPVRLNQSQYNPLFQERGIVWTPTIATLSAQGQELDRWVGFLPPEAFLPRLKLAHAIATWSRGEFGQAAMILDALVAHHHRAQVAAEALYWLGVCRFKARRTFEALCEPWAQLTREFPDSEWAMKASCLS